MSAFYSWRPTLACRLAWGLLTLNPLHAAAQHSHSSHEEPSATHFDEPHCSPPATHFDEPHWSPPEHTYSQEPHYSAPAYTPPTHHYYSEPPAHAAEPKAMHVDVPQAPPELQREKTATEHQPGTWGAKEPAAGGKKAEDRAHQKIRPFDAANHNKIHEFPAGKRFERAQWSPRHGRYVYADRYNLLFFFDVGLGCYLPIDDCPLAEDDVDCPPGPVPYPDETAPPWMPPADGSDPAPVELPPVPPPPIAPRPLNLQVLQTAPQLPGTIVLQGPSGTITLRTAPAYAVSPGWNSFPGPMPTMNQVPWPSVGSANWNGMPPTNPPPWNPSTSVQSTPRFPLLRRIGDALRSW